MVILFLLISIPTVKNVCVHILKVGFADQIVQCILQAIYVLNFLMSLMALAIHVLYMADLYRYFDSPLGFHS